jgi:Uncharacterized KleE stable inheritance protein
MANVIKFPKQPGSFNKLDPVLRSPQATKAKPDYANGVIKLFWVIGVLAWPLIKLVLSIDCVVQFMRMLYFWNSTGHNGGAIFLLHFSLLTLLTYFVTIYKPKGI